MELPVRALQRGKEAGRVGGHELFSSSATVSPGFPSSTPPALIPKDPQWAYSTARPALHTQWCVHSTVGKTIWELQMLRWLWWYRQNLTTGNTKAFSVTVTTWMKPHPCLSSTLKLVYCIINMCSTNGRHHSWYISEFRKCILLVPPVWAAGDERNGWKCKCAKRNVNKPNLLKTWKYSPHLSN